jgi:hypothetical protein
MSLQGMCPRCGNEAQLEAKPRKVNELDLPNHVEIIGKWGNDIAYHCNKCHKLWSDSDREEIARLKEEFGKKEGAFAQAAEHNKIIVQETIRRAQRYFGLAEILFNEYSTDAHAILGPGPQQNPGQQQAPAAGTQDRDEAERQRRDIQERVEKLRAQTGQK